MKNGVYVSEPGKLHRTRRVRAARWELLRKKAVRIVGMSEETTSYVVADYFWALTPPDGA